MLHDAQVLLPKRRSLKRWYKLSKSPHTLLRALEYEAIDGLSLVGRVLDIGGDWRSGYHELLRVRGEIETININEKLKPTYLADLENPLPFEEGFFDHVLSLNTFEHIMNDEMAISEAIRVIKKEGTFHFMVPFCYRVHGSPHDFHRHTAYWWSKIIAGVGVNEYKIEPLVWDRRSSAYAIMGLKGLIRAVLMFMALVDIGDWARRLKDFFPFLRALPWRPGAARVSADEREVIIYKSAASFALGYYISGKK
jgi:SAM-dependent methyltransferase